MTELEKIVKESKLKCLELVHKAGTSHIGSLFSCAELFAVIFDKIDLEKDEFVLSAGWKAAMLYFHLWKKGKITEEELNSFCIGDSKYIGLAEPVNQFIKIAGGSMGLGFPGAVGLALAKKLKKEKGRVYCFMSDGEMQIGTTWESAMIASHHKLDNLTVIVDINRLQAMGLTEEILNIQPLERKWHAFGWLTREVNGHNHDLIAEALDYPPDITQPQAVLAQTVKGNGIPWMANNNLFHYAQIKEDDYKKALAELNA